MDYADALTEQDQRLGAVLREADPDAAVPACPGWTMRDLLVHVGRGHRWAATIVRDRASEPVDIRTVPDGKPPADLTEAVGWLLASGRLLLDAVAATRAPTPVWTFTGPQPAAWWIRRRLHETTVHRADAELAIGTAYELDADLAADGLSEWLDLLTARRYDDSPPLPGGATLHLHATDSDLGSDGEWVIRGADGALAWTHAHEKGAAAVRASAVDLLLGTLRRIPADDPRLEVLGDRAVWLTWLERTGF